MNYNFFNQDTKPRNYLPDSIYTLCGEETQDCTICSNKLWSPIVNGFVHDSQNGKVFCPFGKADSMNKSIYTDQAFLNNLNNLPATTWGRVPQLDPRPLAKIGLSFRVS